MDFDLNRKKENSTYKSPYLNFDPSILRPSNTSQFIIPEGQSEQRGKMEMSFLKIGAAVIIGGAFGSMNGLYLGLKETSALNGTAAKRSMLINYVAKQGSKSSQVFGSLALMFSLYDTLFTYARDVDDQLNIIPAAVATGMTFSVTNGIKSIAKSGIIGLGLSLAYLTYSNNEVFASHLPNLTGGNKY